MYGITRCHKVGTEDALIRRKPDNPTNLRSDGLKNGFPGPGMW